MVSKLQYMEDKGNQIIPSPSELLLFVTRPLRFENLAK
jgi:hypothetical protein